MKFNDSLARILAEQNLRQADLCRMTGISTALMSKYMTDKASPSLDNALTIAKALGITLDDLVGHKRDSTRLTKKQTTLLNDFEGLNDDGQNLVITMLGSLKVSHAKKEQKRSAVVQQNSGGTNFLVTGGKNSYGIVTS